MLILSHRYLPALSAAPSIRNKSGEQLSDPVPSPQTAPEIPENSLNTGPTLTELRAATNQSQNQPFFTSRDTLSVDSDSDDGLDSSNEEDFTNVREEKTSEGTSSVPKTEVYAGLAIPLFWASHRTVDPSIKRSKLGQTCHIYSKCSLFTTNVLDSST
ncbi:hypothetical protein M422DRAFT_247632 [Sphaerobolus stellatus SS14]|nr:hypothetical protein M422DRAFT_247632 [Sphaerobolus stellatus SS14]